MCGVSHPMFTLRKSRQWYWIPITVITIGMLSIILLLSVDRLRERQRINSTLIEAAMRIQINTATFHLWIEESFGGVKYDPQEVGEVLTGMDQAISLAGLVRNGRRDFGEGLISGSRDDLELRSHAEEISSLLIKFKSVGMELQGKPEIVGFGSDADKQFDALYKSILDKSAVVEHSIEANRDRTHAKSRNLFLGIIVVWTFVLLVATTALWNLAMKKNSAEELLLKVNNQLFSQAEELREHRENLSEMVARRTDELTAANRLLRVEIEKHRQTETALTETETRIRQLSAYLLRAQEIERRRISMELHDELGQALNATKLRIRIIEKGLTEAQFVIREDCEKLLEYMDQIIENVRRLSLDLSPTILDDLGLTSALQWLVDNYKKNPHMKVRCDIENIDRLFHTHHWITIYRIVQEALTNIGKHAQAENVSLIIRHHNDQVTFTVEDDGKGFDSAQAAVRHAPERGLGLATMGERVRMIGGVLDVWSKEGKGTRITFRIPMEKGETQDGPL